MAHKHTRNKTEHPAFGSPCELPPTKLPTLGDTVRLIWKYKCDEENQGLDFRVSDKNKAIKNAAHGNGEIWEKALGDRNTVPLVSQKAIEGRLKRSYEKGIQIVRYKNKKDMPKFKESLTKLFDICSCTCPSTTCQDIKCMSKNCDGYHLKCKCVVKVPKREIRFLIDQ